jgi:uncharacterized repeat protein (TIGR03803 family)
MILLALTNGHKDAQFMKTCFKCFLSSSTIIALALTLSARVLAEDVTLVYEFTYYEAGNQGGLLLWSNTLFGTSAGSGIGILGHVGTVFSVNTDGSDVAELHKFGTSGDGDTPYGGLVLSGDTLYGTTLKGNPSSIVFSVKTNGVDYTILRSFALSDGVSLWSGLVLSSNTLYGVAARGGSVGMDGGGTVFRLNTDGTGFQVLHNFSSIYYPTNDDGAEPVAGLLLSGDTLFGTTSLGGTGGAGTIFSLKTDGSEFKTLHTFSQTNSITGTNIDGASPASVLILSGNTLYGTAMIGGVSSNGTVFKLNTDGTDFTLLHSFTAGTGRNPWLSPTNDDGAQPNGGLLLWNDTLYGTAQFGGSWGNGTIFALNTDGTGFTVLHTFTGTYSQPLGSLIVSGSVLYGEVKSTGHNIGAGAVFRLPLSVTPKLSIARSAANVILTWPTDFVGYNLYSTTNLDAPAWTAVSSGPVVINGLNTVTNPISFERQFFRLSQ